MGNSRTQNNLQHFQFKDTLVYIVLTNVHLGLQANNPQKGLHIYLFMLKAYFQKFSQFCSSTSSFWVTGHFETSAPSNLTPWRLLGKGTVTHICCTSVPDWVSNFSPFVVWPPVFKSQAIWFSRNFYWNHHQQIHITVNGVTFWKVHQMTPKWIWTVDARSSKTGTARNGPENINRQMYWYTH